VPLGEGVALLLPMHRERLARRCATLSAVAIPVTVQAAYSDRPDVGWRGGSGERRSCHEAMQRRVPMA